MTINDHIMDLLRRDQEGANRTSIMEEKGILKQTKEGVIAEVREEIKAIEEETKTKRKGSRKRKAQARGVEVATSEVKGNLGEEKGLGVLAYGSEPSVWLKGYCERKWMKIKEVEKKPCKCGGQIWQVGAGRATFRICENGECASNEHWK